MIKCRIGTPEIPQIQRPALQLYQSRIKPITLRHKRIAVSGGSVIPTLHRADRNMVTVFRWVPILVSKNISEGAEHHITDFAPGAAAA